MYTYKGDMYKARSDYTSYKDKLYVSKNECDMSLTPNKTNDQKIINVPKPIRFSQSIRIDFLNAFSK
jgi:hypothetical protein